MAVECKDLLNESACVLINNAITLYGENKFYEAHLEINHYMQSYGEYARSQLQKTDSTFEELILSFVVVTAGVSEDKLERCLLSILDQQYQNINLTLVANGCKISPRILSILSLQKYSSFNILILLIPINIYPSEARNFGAFASTGEWIVFVDDEDVNVMCI